MLPAPRQLVNRLRGLRRLSRRDPNRLSCSIGEPAFPSRPGAARATARNGGDGRSGATRSHAQRALSREHGEDGEHRTFPEVSTVAHSAPVGGSGRRAPLRSVTSRNQGIKTRPHIRGERCLPRRRSSGFGPKHHFMRHLTPPVLQPTLQRPQLPIRVDAGLLCLQPLK